MTASVRKLKHYWAFTRFKNFACIETRKTKLLIHLNLDPSKVKLVLGFTRDMRGIGHWGTGDLQLEIGTAADFEKAKVLIARAYEGRTAGA